MCHTHIVTVCVNVELIWIPQMHFCDVLKNNPCTSPCHSLLQTWVLSPLLFVRRKSQTLFSYS